MVFYQYIISKEKEDKTMFKKNGLLKSPDSKPKESAAVCGGFYRHDDLVHSVYDSEQGHLSLLWRLQLTADDVLSALS